MKIKICSKCKEELPITEFHTDRNTKDRLCYTCKSCQKIYKEEHRKELKKYIKDYHQIHKNEAKKYYKFNKNKIIKRQKDYYKTPTGIYNQLKGNAKHRNIEFNIKKEIFIEWYQTQDQKCHYCERTPKESRQIDGFGKNIQRLTIDRKNNDKGYILNNIVLSCIKCNDIKGNYFTEKEMLKIGKIIKFKKEE